MQILIGLLLGVLISLLAYRFHALSRSGALAAAVSGGLVFGLGGLSWAILLLAFFISSVTQPFCAACTRARLTADGRLRLCLLREGEVDLLAPLRQGATLADLRQVILDGIWHKPWGHGLAQGIIPLNRVMNEIGG